MPELSNVPEPSTALLGQGGMRHGSIIRERVRSRTRFYLQSYNLMRDRKVALTKRC